MTRALLNGCAALALFSTAASPTHAQVAKEVVALGHQTSVLMGTDGNVVILAGPDGTLLIDDERSRDLGEIRSAVHNLTPGPVRYVIDTHWHLDHSGGNAGLAQDGATIIAHRNVRERLGRDQFMAAYNQTVPASPSEALPTIVYDDEMDIHFNDETVRLIHTPAAHTDGDTLVRLQDANVLHMGDVFFNGLFPFIDRSSGGSIQGLIAAVDVGLATSNEQTVIVPAHGPLATRADLRAYREMLVDMRDQVGNGIALGQTIEQIQAAQPGTGYRLEGEREQLVSAIYNSLKP